MGYGILNDSGTTELTAGEGIFLGGDATDYDGNAVTGRWKRALPLPAGR
jgi:thioredoxin reductase